MGLSYDLISEFVKITNDKKENTKEGTVYATVVSGTGGKYVRIDGSDLLTPMDTTTDIEDGERVTLMIKDHKAIVTGNVTTPSASTTKVDKVTESVNSVSDRVGTFELVVADKVSTNELEAYKATIEVLIANKATIEDLTATNAKIENLEVKNAEIENLVAEKATIEDLEAVNATIENLKVKDAEIENAVVENLKATTADIKILNADFAQIKTLVNGNLTSDNILSFNLTSEKVTVDDAFIKDAMIDTISAGKINAGKINTNSVSIGSEDGGMLITGSTQQFTDKNGNVRIQIGKDASGDFTFILYGEDGQGQIINQNGITASAISDGLIVNNMVSDHAAISGGKLDISSVITEINSDNSTTIKSSKIYLNEQAQSLEVAFNSLKTKVDTIQEITIEGDLTAIVKQVQSNTSKIEANKDSINTLISEDTVIKKQVTDLQGTLNETETTLNSKYTSLSQNLDGFKTTVADTYATKKSVTDVVDNIETNYSTTSVMNSAIEQKAQEISASVSSTYATKNQVNTLDNNLRTNYSTTQQMESAINVAKQEINLGVSTIYETKENVETKIKDISVGGTNLAFDTNKGVTSWDWAMQTNGGRTIEEYVADGIKGVKMTKDTNDSSGWNYVSYGRFKRDKITPATTYVVSFEMKSNQTFNVESVNLLEANVTNGLAKTITAVQNKVTADSIAWSKIIFKLVTHDTLPSSTSQVIYITGIPNSANATHYFRNLKLEVGNTPTAWSPAPEDVTNDISTAKTEAITSANNTLTNTIKDYYTKKQTDSQINVAKDAINLGVSTTYETKSNVESKVTSTLNSAKSYADTKKSEAISTAASDATSKANTAKQEAISSANNTLTSTISNYYTKTQTDSQINIAKEAINLSVSNTYETKTNVQNKINGINIGGRNLARQSNRFINGTGAPGITSAVYNDGSLSVTAESGKGDWYKLGIITSEGIEDGFNEDDEFTISFIASSYDTTTIPDIYIKEGMGYYPMKGTLTSNDSMIYYSGKWKKNNSINLHLGFNGIVGTITFRKWKIEKGNKPTDWTPAPEDVENDISSLEYETKSIKENVSSLVLDTGSINASVKALQETVTKTADGLASDIASIQDQVNLKMSSNDVKLEIQKEMSKGANKVSTSTGFTFDENGLNISKTDSEMETQITEDGMKIYKNSEVMLTANNQGVDAKNLHATTYLIIGNNSRMEDFTESGSKRTAIFWIGQS